MYREEGFAPGRQDLLNANNPVFRSASLIVAPLTFFACDFFALTQIRKPRKRSIFVSSRKRSSFEEFDPRAAGGITHGKTRPVGNRPFEDLAINAIVSDGKTGYTENMDANFAVPHPPKSDTRSSILFVEYRNSYITCQLGQIPGPKYFRARYYHAELGRFVSRDPFGYVDGMNSYRAYFVLGGAFHASKDLVPTDFRPTEDPLAPDVSIPPPIFPRFRPSDGAEEIKVSATVLKCVNDQNEVF